MINKFNFGLLSFSSLLLFCTQGYAHHENEALGDMLEMSVEELLNVEINIASVSPQQIAKAPLIVSRYERSDLVAMGADSLASMLQFVPGILLQNTQSGNLAIMSRGLVESFNQKILFLLDGVPYWAPSHSAIPLNGIPFESISHIEVIRGPAAVYYGTNASAAVINVITHKESDNRISLTKSSDIKQASAIFNYHNDELWTSLSLEKKQDKGMASNIQNLQPSLGLLDNGSFLISEEHKSLLFRLGYKGLSFSAHSFESIFSGHNNDIPFSVTNGLTYQGQLYHLDYQYDFYHTNMKVFTDFNQFELRFPIKHILTALGSQGDGGFKFEDGKNNYRWRAGISANSTFSDNWSLLYGYEYEHRQTSEYQVFDQITDNSLFPIMQAGKNNEQAFYLQSNHQYNDWRVLVGGRYVDNKQSGTHLSPQLSFVYQFKDPQSLKLLYSEGFNSPNFVQQGINLGNALQGNPNLEAEIIKTFDFAYTYSADNQLFVTNLFYTKAKNLVQRDVSSGQVIFNNTGENKRSGLEIDYQLAKNNWTLFTNLSVVLQGNKPDQDMSAFVVPKYLASTGFKYKLSSKHNIGTGLHYVSKRAESNAYLDWSASYQYKFDQFQISANIKNLLDKDITNADVQNFTSNQTITMTQGTYLTLNFLYHFNL